MFPTHRLTIPQGALEVVGHYPPLITGKVLLFLIACGGNSRQ